LRSRSHIGALLLGYYTPEGRLRYAGRAGTGVADRGLKRLADVLKPLRTPQMPLASRRRATAASAHRSTSPACIGCGRRSWSK